jgi:NAD(P)-dependent dehydrogenase (short-subunit alcohol dehydrogenase family)
MFATEFALKGIPVRVNSIAPGVYESEMTLDTISGPEQVARIAESIVPVPAGRPGTYVYVRCADFFLYLTRIRQSWRSCWYGHLSSIPSGVLHQWARDRCGWKLYCRQSCDGLI